MPKMHILNSVTNTIVTPFIIESERGLVVVDGGYDTETENFSAKLSALGGKVCAWFITHNHDDHSSVLSSILENNPLGIEIEKVYFNFPSEEYIYKYGDQGEIASYQRLTAAVEYSGVQKITPQVGDVFEFGDIKITVLLTPDESVTVNVMNNSSIVFRLDTANSSVMFLGDLGAEGGTRLIQTTPHNLLHCDYVQMAHHGQNGVLPEVYEIIQPRCCIWCTPSWLWDNVGNHGYDSGNFKTVVMRGKISEMGVRRHYVTKDGPHTLEI